MKLPDILSAFHLMPTCDRLDLICRLLRTCVPYELRFLGTVVLDATRAQMKSFASTEGVANRVNHYAGFREGGFTHAVCEKLCCALALVQPHNHPVAEAVFGILDNPQVLQLFEETTDLKVLDDLRLLYVMAANHPALSYHQRQHLLYVYLQRMDMMYSEKCRLNLTRHVMSSVEKSGEGGRDSGTLRREPGKDAVMTYCDVHSVYKPDKRYAYMIQVDWSDGTSSCVRRTYGDFFSFHTKLLDQFPEEGGQKHKKERMIPFLPGKSYPRLLTNRNSKDLAEKRLPELHRYAKELLSLPERISQCKHVLDFFRPRPEDLKDEYPPVEKITTLYELLESGKARLRNYTDPIVTKGSPAQTPQVQRSSPLHRATADHSQSRTANTLPHHSSSSAPQAKEETSLERRFTYPSRRSAFTPVTPPQQHKAPSTPANLSNSHPLIANGGSPLTTTEAAESSSAETASDNVTPSLPTSTSSQPTSTSSHPTSTSSHSTSTSSHPTSTSTSSQPTSISSHPTSTSSQPTSTSSHPTSTSSQPTSTSSHPTSTSSQPTSTSSHPTSTSSQPTSTSSHPTSTSSHPTPSQPTSTSSHPTSTSSQPTSTSSHPTSTSSHPTSTSSQPTSSHPTSTSSQQVIHSNTSVVTTSTISIITSSHPHAIPTSTTSLYHSANVAKPTPTYGHSYPHHNITTVTSPTKPLTISQITHPHLHRHAVTSSPPPIQSGKTTPIGEVSYSIPLPIGAPIPLFNPIVIGYGSPIHSPSPSPLTPGLWGKSSSNIVRTPTEYESLSRWLKSHRLHKYAPIFDNMTFDELLLMDKDALKSKGMTEGAAKKLVGKIEELKAHNFNGFRDMPYNPRMSRKPSTCSLPAALHSESRATPCSSVDGLSPTDSTCSLDKVVISQVTGTPGELFLPVNGSHEPPSVANYDMAILKAVTAAQSVTSADAATKTSSRPHSVASPTSPNSHPHTLSPLGGTCGSDVQSESSTLVGSDVASQSKVATLTRSSAGRGTEGSWADRLDAGEDEREASTPEWAQLHRQGSGRRSHTPSHTSKHSHTPVTKWYSAELNDGWSHTDHMTSSRPQYHPPPTTLRNPALVQGASWIHRLPPAVLQHPAGGRGGGRHRVPHHSVTPVGVNGLVHSFAPPPPPLPVAPVLPRPAYIPSGGVVPGYPPVLTNHSRGSLQPPSPACFNCGKKGHYGTSCPADTMDTHNPDMFHRQLERLAATQAASPNPHGKA